MSTPTFILGTGRCGSTMLSNMLREHPKILSLSEFFSAVGSVSSLAFSTEPMDGEQFWAVIGSTSPSFDLFTRHGIVLPEWLYPCDAPRAPFSMQSGIPPLLLVALPHLTDEYHELFDQIRDEVSKWSVAKISEHYRRLFQWLEQRFGKRMWIERSGSSLFILGDQALSLFPEARFIHIARDGRDVALSMQTHLGFKYLFVMSSLHQALGVNPLESPDPTQIKSVPAELRQFLPENFDADALRALHIPAPVCAEFWTQQIVVGMKVLSAVPAKRLLTLRYEDILSDPMNQLDTFTAFLGEEFVDEGWSARCAATVRTPRSTWRDLPEDEAHALTEACRPGFEQLAAAGVHYDV